MGILDDAIREHLDLKRKHGARDAELREIEDEAFGSADQPDAFAAGGELFGAVAPAGGESEAGGEEPTRLVEPEALRGEPEAPAPEPDLGEFEEPSETAEDVSPPPGQPELPGQDEIPGQERLDEAMEDHAAPSAPSAEPEPPSPSESLEELIAEEEPFPEDTAAPHTEEEPGPSADRGGALEVTELEPHEEPPPSVPDPPPPPPGEEPPGRARGRVDVPTQEHPPPGQTGDLPPWPSESAEEPASEAPPLEEPEAVAEPEAAEEPEAGGGAPALYDFETEDEPLATEGREADDFEALGPAEEEAAYLEEEEPYTEEPAPDTGAPLDDADTAVRPALEDEEAYDGEDLEAEESYEQDEGEDELWFEKGPPKDFDFDD
jgi:hypothetical protein